MYKEFQSGESGGHPGYKNGIILAILNVALIPDINISSTQQR